MSLLPYCVVSFEDGTCSEIPSNWLIGNELCWWPRGSLIKSINTLMEKCVEPTGKNWEQHSVQVELYCKTLHTARQKAQDPDYTSSEEKGRGYRKKKRRLISNSDSENESETPPPQFNYTDASQSVTDEAELNITDFPLIILPPAENSSIDSAATLVSPISQATKSSTQIVTPVNMGTPTFVTPVVSSKTMTPNMSDPHHDNTNRVLEVCTQILFYVKSLDKRLKILESNENDQGTANHLTEVFKNKLPIINEEMLHQFEHTLSTEENMVASYMAFLKKLGGATYQEFVNRSLKNTISYEFGTKCSWLGLRNNIRICDFKFIKLVKDVAYDTYHCSDTVVEKTGSEWFRLCSLRLKRQQKKGTTTTAD